MRRAIRRLTILVTKPEWLEMLAFALADFIGRLLAPKQKPSTEPPIPIDAVYFWVDDTDIEWRRKKSEFDHQSIDSDSPSRFRSFGELQASIRLLAKNAQWIRKVFIVTDSQIPQLDVTGSYPFEIVIVDHTEILKRNQLPTFSSRALTANLHRISDLSEAFIYMNDDTFIAAPSVWSDFFELKESVGPVAKLRNTNTQMPPKESLQLDEVVFRSRYVTNELAGSKGWPVPPGPPEHGGHAMLKSVVAKLWDELPSEMLQASSERFRTSSTVLSEWLHDSLALKLGLAQDASGLTGYKYVAMNHPDAAGALVDVLLKRGRILVLCLNDEAGLKGAQTLSPERLQRRFARILPRL